MPKCRVLVNENARYMDESERSDHGVLSERGKGHRRLQSDGR